MINDCYLLLFVPFYQTPSFPSFLSFLPIFHLCSIISYQYPIILILSLKKEVVDTHWRWAQKKKSSEKILSPRWKSSPRPLHTLSDTLNTVVSYGLFSELSACVCQYFFLIWFITALLTLHISLSVIFYFPGSSVLFFHFSFHYIKFIRSLFIILLFSFPFW